MVDVLCSNYNDTEMYEHEATHAGSGLSGGCPGDAAGDNSAAPRGASLGWLTRFKIQAHRGC